MAAATNQSLDRPRRGWLRDLWLAVPPSLAAVHSLAFLVRSHVMTHLFGIDVVARPAAWLIGLSLVLYGSLRVVLRNSRSAAVAATLFFVLLGMLPHMFPVPGEHDGWLTGAFTAVSLGLAIAGTKLLDGFFDLVICWALSAVVGWTIAYNVVVSNAIWPEPRWTAVVDEIAAGALDVQLPRGGEKPDIYYIILDGMGRTDVLERLYGVDTKPAIRELEALGVQVPRLSRSNYSQTQLSLASAMNMQYLTDLRPVMGDENDRRPLNRLIVDGGVMPLLKQHGYEFIVVGSTASITSHQSNPDRCLCGLPDGPTEFERAVLSRLPGRGPHVDRWGMAAHRRQVLRSLDLVESVRSHRPKFVMTHVVTPHPPFVFAADGSERIVQDYFTFFDGDGFPGTRDEYVAGYRAQSTFVLRRIASMIEHIVAESPEALIIVHSDHGPGLGLVNTSVPKTDSWERLAIFSAYYSGGRDAKVADDMSPVNALRWALRTGLGATIPLLPDRSYLSDYEHPYQWHEIPRTGAKPD